MTNSTPTLAVWRGTTLVAKLIDNETPKNVVITKRHDTGHGLLVFDDPVENIVRGIMG